MKKTYTVEASHEDGDSEIIVSVKAMSWAFVVNDMNEWFRHALKYGHKYESIDLALEAARSHLYETMEDHGVSLGDIQ